MRNTTWPQDALSWLERVFLCTVALIVEKNPKKVCCDSKSRCCPILQIWCICWLMLLSFLLLHVDHWCQASITRTLLRLLWRDWGNDPSPFPHNSFAAIHCQSISPIFFTKLENSCLRSFCLKLKSPQWRENLGNAKISYLIGRDRGV